MKLLKTTKADGTQSFLPYSEKTIESLMDANKYGVDSQKMTVEVVEEHNPNTPIETIYRLQQHKVAPDTLAKETALSEKELELQRKENELKDREAKLKKREKELTV